LAGNTPAEGHLRDTSGREGGDGGGVESACSDVGWELKIYLCMYAYMCVCVFTVLGGYTPAEGYVHDTSGREGGDGGGVGCALG